MGYSKTERSARISTYPDSGEICARPNCSGSLRLVRDSLMCNSCFVIAGFEESVDHMKSVKDEKDAGKQKKLKEKKLKELRETFKSKE